MSAAMIASAINSAEKSFCNGSFLQQFPNGSFLHQQQQIDLVTSPQLSTRDQQLEEEVWRGLRIRQLEDLMQISRVDMAQVAETALDKNDFETPLPISVVDLEPELDHAALFFSLQLANTQGAEAQKRIIQKAFIPNKVPVVITSGNLIEELSVNLLLPRCVKAPNGQEFTVAPETSSATVFLASENQIMELLAGKLTVQEAIETHKIIKLQYRADKRSCASSSDDEVPGKDCQQQQRSLSDSSLTNTGLKFRRVSMTVRNTDIGANHRLLATFKNVKLPAEWAFLDGRLRATKHHPQTRKQRLTTRSKIKGWWLKDEDSDEERSTADPLKKYYFVFVAELSSYGPVWTVSFPVVVQTNCGKQNCLSYAGALLYYSYMYEHGDPYCSVESRSLRKRHRVSWNTLLHAMNWIFLSRVGSHCGLTRAQGEYLKQKLMLETTQMSISPNNNEAIQASQKQQQQFGWSDLFSNIASSQQTQPHEQVKATQHSYWEWFYGAVNLMQFVEARAKETLLHQPNKHRPREVAMGPWDLGYILGFLPTQSVETLLDNAQMAGAGKTVALTFSENMFEGISLHTISNGGKLVPITEFSLDDLKQMNLADKLVFCPLFEALNIVNIYPNKPIRSCSEAVGVDQWCVPKSKSQNGFHSWRVAVIFEDNESIKSKILDAEPRTPLHHSLQSYLTPRSYANTRNVRNPLQFSSSNLSELSLEEDSHTKMPSIPTLYRESVSPHSCSLILSRPSSPHSIIRPEFPGSPDIETSANKIAAENQLMKLLSSQIKDYGTKLPPELLYAYLAGIQMKSVNRMFGCGLPLVDYARTTTTNHNYSNSCNYAPSFDCVTSDCQSLRSQEHKKQGLSQGISSSDLNNASKTLPTSAALNLVYNCTKLPLQHVDPPARNLDDCCQCISSQNSNSSINGSGQGRRRSVIVATSSPLMSPKRSHSPATDYVSHSGVGDVQDVLCSASKRRSKSRTPSDDRRS